MVGLVGNRSELARLSAIDFVTGEVLVDALVQPPGAVADWRTRFSGITRQAMRRATAAGQVLRGWAAARAELWRHVDAQTVVVGQALRHDFAVLRMVHARVVDSSILVGDAVAVGKKQFGLAKLCEELLGVGIQKNRKAGHDSVEDAFAAREVVLWCLNHDRELQEWAARKRVALLEEEEKRRLEREKRKEMEKEKEKKRLEKEKEKEREREREGEMEKSPLERPSKLKQSSGSKLDFRKECSDYDDFRFEEDFGSEEEFGLEEDFEFEGGIRLEDLAEELGWPEGYDPWSD